MKQIEKHLPRGSKYGMLTVLCSAGRMPNGTKQSTWASMCRCDCGELKVVKNTVLVRSLTLSCGCLGGVRHGMSATKLYRVWTAMRQRCHLAGTIQQKDYMDRGISVCDEWRNSFEAFSAWADKSGYSPGLQIDRIDNDGNYSPSNCRWVTQIVNANNKRNNVRLSYHGVTMTLMNAIRKAGKECDVAAIRARISNGWDPQEAVDAPLRVGRYKEGKAAAKQLRQETNKVSQ